MRSSADCPLLLSGHWGFRAQRHTPRCSTLARVISTFGVQGSQALQSLRAGRCGPSTGASASSPKWWCGTVLCGACGWRFARSRTPCQSAAYCVSEAAAVAVVGCSVHAKPSILICDTNRACPGRVAPLGLRVPGSCVPAQAVCRNCPQPRQAYGRRRSERAGPELRRSPDGTLGALVSYRERGNGMGNAAQFCSLQPLAYITSIKGLNNPR
jgi:hypothetical protein